MFCKVIGEAAIVIKDNPVLRACAFASSIGGCSDIRQHLLGSDLFHGFCNFGLHQADDGILQILACQSAAVIQCQPKPVHICTVSVT